MRHNALRATWYGPVGQPGAGLAEVLQVAVVASLASARRRDGLTCCDVQLNT
jgi:hypothetical protein